MSVSTMTDEQKALFDGMTTLQQRMATNTLLGMSPAEAHKASGGRCKNEDHRYDLAFQILVKPSVKSFLDSFKQQAVSKAIMGRDEMLERLTTLARANMKDMVDFSTVELTGPEGEPVKQSVWSFKDSLDQDDACMESISELATSKEGLKVKLHSPLSAMKQLAEMEGFNAPVKVEVSDAELTPWADIKSGVDE